MFFDILSMLCQQRNVSRYKAATAVGLNRAVVAKWKNGAVPTGKTLAKLGQYFGVTTDYLLGVSLDAQVDLTRFKIAEVQKSIEAATDDEKEEIMVSLAVLQDSLDDLVLVQTMTGQQKTEAHTEAPDDTALKFALFGDTTEIDDADLEDVKRYAAFVKERKLAKKNGVT